MDSNISIDGSGQTDLIELVADIASAYVSNNSVPPSELPALLSNLHAAIAGLGNASTLAEPAADKPTPAQIRKSITHDALISFVDGKPYKTLKRHLNGNGLTIEQYRERYGLPRDYPSTAAGYSEQRSKLALALGLGQQRKKGAPKAAEVSETISEAPKARGRKKAAEPAATPVEKPARGRKPKATAAVN